MQKVTANQPFYGKRDEHMWLVGDTREVSDERAAELLKAGLVSDPDEHTAAMAAQNKVLDDANSKATADKLKKLSDEAKKASDAAKLDNAQREKEAKAAADKAAKEAADKAAKEAAELAEKEAKELAERKTKEDKDAADLLTKDQA
jgi:colicin import membrane protein